MERNLIWDDVTENIFQKLPHLDGAELGQQETHELQRYRDVLSRNIDRRDCQPYIINNLEQERLSWSRGMPYAVWEAIVQSLRKAEKMADAYLELLVFGWGVGAKCFTQRDVTVVPWIQYIVGLSDQLTEAQRHFRNERLPSEAIARRVNGKAVLLP